MKGDFSRKTFDKEKNYSGVYLQQGRVLLDSDFNEQREITNYYLRSYIRDIIGPCGTPQKNPGFKILPSKSGFKIGAGHYYVDGILCVNNKEIQHSSQPYFPITQKSESLALQKNDGIYLVYLDVWERHITSLEDSELLEPALGGPDTTTRKKIIWQVKTQPVKKRGKKRSKNCSNFFSVPLKISNGKMRAYDSTRQENDAMSQSGYTGLENRLYRVEIHKGGNSRSSEPPTFKWSNRNAVEAALVDEISPSSIIIGRSQGTGINFEKQDWIEIIDERHILHVIPGSFVRISEVEENKIIFDSSSRIGENVSTINFPLKYNPIIRKWNGSKSPLQKVISDDNYHISLEYGIEIQFTEGTYRSGDYWIFPARPQVGVLWEKEDGVPKFRQPDGIEHHYCPLALLKLQKNKYTLLSDCRKFFLALTDLV